MKPTFDMAPGTYFGGKGAAGVVHAIINQIPKHTVFVSGFLGRCAVMRWKRPALINIGIDLDTSLMAEWGAAAQRSSAPPLVLVSGSFFEWATTGAPWEDCFVYLDPPYLPDVRTSRNRYRHELTQEQHEQLLEIACSLPYKIAISCYDHPLYARKLAGWRKITFNSQTRGGPRVETLYMNYPAPAPKEIHDPRFLGGNFREREKGKRRIETIKGKIERLEPQELARLLQWLQHLVASQE